MTNIDIYPSTKVHPYVYRGFNTTTSESYIGSRTANKVPSHLDLGIKYKTSSWKHVEPRFHEFEWSIIAEFYTAGDAYDFEQLLIFESWKQPGTLNERCTHGKTRFWRNGPATGKAAKGMPKTGKTAKGMPATGKNAKGMPNTGKAAKGMPNTGGSAKGVPKTGKHAKGMPRGPGTGKNAKGVPATGKAAKGVPKTGKNAKGVPHGPHTGKNAKGVPKTGKNAKGVSRPKRACVHCGISMDAGNLAKLHNDNCKLRH